MASEKLSWIPEIIVVEGIHDRQAVSRAAQADIWVLGGDRVSQRTLGELRRAVRIRGVIVLTDPDGPGERIRRRIDQAVPGCRHAVLSKSDALGEGRVGVEYAKPDAIWQALEQARPPRSSEPHRPEDEGRNAERSHQFTIADLTDAGLAHHAEAARNRKLVGEQLGIGYGNVKAFLHKLNALAVQHDEWLQALDWMKERSKHASTD